MIYLDHNATTDIYPEVLEKMQKVSKHGPLNPSSIHSNGQRAKAFLEKARKSIANLLGFRDNRRKYQITFTSTGTEANNLIISNFKDQEIFISATEHPSIYEYSKTLKNITIINVDKNGALDLEDLTRKLQKSESEKKLVSVMLANNETGVIQPIKEICEIAHQYKAYVHSDAIQAIGKIAVDIEKLGVDFMSISAHKFGGSIGAAALIAKSSIPIRGMIIGGGQERSLRSGTENVPAIVGFGIAAQIVFETLEQRHLHMLELRNKLEKKLLESNNQIEIVGQGAKRLPNTSLILNVAKKAEIQLIALDLKGIAVSSGSACSSGKSSPSHVLLAMGYEKNIVYSAIRVSVGASSCNQDIDKFIEVYNEINK